MLNQEMPKPWESAPVEHQMALKNASLSSLIDSETGNTTQTGFNMRVSPHKIRGMVPHTLVSPITLGSLGKVSK